MIEKFKDVTTEDGREFRVGLLTAMTGNWVLSQILTGKISDEEVFQKAQSYCLSVCWIYREPEPGAARMPVKVFEGGRWLAPELEYDLTIVNELWDQVTRFNFGPFLKKLELKAEAAKELLSATQGFSPSNSPTT